MTDTLTAADITPAMVTATITALGTTLQRATARLGEEEAEFIAKRDRMVQVAHRRGTENGIGEALDDLLEEFDLPRRPPRSSFRALVSVTAPLSSRGDYLQTEPGTYVYRGPGVRVTWPVALDTTCMMVPERDDTCLCDNAEANVREWLTSYYGAPQARVMTFQFANVFCGLDTCPNDHDFPDSSQAPGIEWHTMPTYVVAQPEVTEPRQRLDIPLAV